jgi:hypothetical protein
MASSKVPPPKVVRAIESARHQLSRLHRRMAPAPIAMMEMIMQAWAAQAITAAANLGIADALAERHCRPTSWQGRSTPTPMLSVDY